MATLSKDCKQYILCIKISIGQVAFRAETNGQQASCFTQKSPGLLTEYTTLTLQLEQKLKGHHIISRRRTSLKAIPSY